MTTVRDLIRYARANDWQHTVWGAWFTKQHVWRSKHWWIQVEAWPDKYSVSVSRRAPITDTLYGPAMRDITDVEDLTQWLTKLGVFPAVEEKAA